MSEANLGIINISMDIEQLRDYCLSLPHSSESMPFGDEPIVYKVVDRIFAIMAPNGGEPRLSLKCDPDRAEDLRAAYPAHHTQATTSTKSTGIPCYLDQHLPPKLLSSLIRHSWNEASAKLTKRVRTELGITPLPEED